MNNFAQFLHSRGLEKLDLSNEKLVELKREYRRIYKRKWQRQADQQVERKQLTFSKEEYRIIERAAKRHKQSFSRFAVNAILAYLKRNYIVLDEFQVQELRLGLKRIGVNVNQVSFHTNRNRSLSHGNLLALQEQMKQLEAFLLRVLTRPDDLNDLVRQALKQHPEYRTILIQILNETNPNAD